MRKNVLLALVLVAAAAATYLAFRPKPTPAEVATERANRVPTDPAPALAPGFPPTLPGATLDGSKTDAVQGGWQRVYTYTAPGKAAEMITFYRKELMAAGLQIMAEGGGTYGAMLRAQDKSGKRALSVDVDAPEEAPKQVPKIKVVIFDAL